MIIKYCPKCYGRPYTMDSLQAKCPRCKTKLQLESAEDEDLEGRECMDAAFAPVDEPSYDEEPVCSPSSDPYTPPQEDPYGNTDDDDFEIPTVAPRDARVLRGRVSNYCCTSSDGSAYHRFGIVKLWQLFVLGQSTEDVLHRFTLWTQSGNEQIPVTVNIHGSLTTGAAIHNNTELMAEGKMHDGIFYAKKLSTIHGSTTSPINIQKTFMGAVYTALAIAALLLLLRIAFNHGLGAVGEWIKVTAILFVILSLLYLFLSITKLGIMLRLISSSNRGFPWKALLAISMILAVFIINGLIRNLGYAAGASLAALLSVLLTVLQPVLILFAVIYLLYRIIKP